MRKKGIPEALVRVMMRLYKGVKTKAEVGTKLSTEYEANVGVHHGFVLSHCLLLLLMLMQKRTEEGMIDKILHADYLALISDTMEELYTCIFHLREKI